MAERYRGVADDVNQSIRTNETSLCQLEEQIDRLADALVSVNTDPIEMQGLYEEERAKLLFDLNEKTTLLNQTLESLKESKETHDKELSQLQDKCRLEKDALVDQLRSSQAELMESYTRLDTAENETERLEWELLRAEEKYKRQNENLIEQNSALMSALQDEQDKSRDVIEDLERSLQTVPLSTSDTHLSESFNPLTQSSPIGQKQAKTALSLLKEQKKRVKELGITNEDLVTSIDELEKALIKESAVSRQYQRKASDLAAEIEAIQSDRPTKRQLEDVQFELQDVSDRLEASQQRVAEMEKVLVASLGKHEKLVGELNKTIDEQNLQIEELKRKNFYPKIMDDLKKENAKLKEEVKKLSVLVKESPSRKVGGLKNKFEDQLKFPPPVVEEKKKPVKDEMVEKMEKMELSHKEEVKHLRNKMTIMEKKLNTSIAENSRLNQELSEAIEQLDDNSFTYENVIQDLHAKLSKSELGEPVISDGIENLELSKLRKTLEAEKEKNKQLESMLVEQDQMKDADDLPPPPPPAVDSLPPPIDSDSLPKPILASSPKPKRKLPAPVISPKPNSLKVLTDRLNESKTQQKQTGEALAKAEGEVKQLTAVLSDLKQEMSLKDDEISRLTSQVEMGITVSVTAHPDIEELEQNLEDSLQDQKHLEETIGVLSTEHETQLAALNSRIAELQRDLEAATKKTGNRSLLDHLEAERKLRAGLEARVEELEFVLAEKAAAKDCSEESLNNLMQNLDEAEKMCEQLMDDETGGNKLAKIVKDKDAQIETLKKENNGLKTEVENLNKELADISLEIADADNQYGQRMENLQQQLTATEEEHRAVVKNLEEEVEMLQEMLEEEKSEELMARLERENAELTNECRVLTDRLATDILKTLSPSDEGAQAVSVLKGHFEKANARLKTELELKEQKILDQQEELKRNERNYARKVAAMKESHGISEQKFNLKHDEEKLTRDSLEKELEQIKKIKSRFEENMEDKNREFNEVVTKLLNLENLIEIQQDNLLAKDEQISTINRQLSNLKAELDIAQQRHNILKEESLTLDVLETSLNEASEHEHQLQNKLASLENKLWRAVEDKGAAEKECAKSKAKITQLQRRLDENRENEKGMTDLKRLRKQVEDLEIQVEDLQDEEERLNQEVATLRGQNEQLEKQARSNADTGQSVSELQSLISHKDKIIEQSRNELNNVLSKQDKTKQDLVTKNIELQNKYNALLEKYDELEKENCGLLDDVDINFKNNTDVVKRFEGELKSLKEAIAEKEDAILRKEEHLNRAEAKNLEDSKAAFDARKNLENQIVALKTRLMEFEGGDAIMRRSSSIHSVWLEDTTSLNQVIGEKDRQIRDLRDSLKRSSQAGSLKGSCMDLTFQSPSLSNLPPPPNIGDFEESLCTTEEYKKQLDGLQALLDKKDAEYNKLYHKYKGDLEKQNTDNTVYNSHIKRMQGMVAQFEKRAQDLAKLNERLIEKSSKGITDVNDSLTNLTDELNVESQRTNEVLGELDLLKSELEEMQQSMSNDSGPEFRQAIDRVLALEDNVQMTVEEHQCSLDHYLLLLQTTQQEMDLISGEMKDGPEAATGELPNMKGELLNILQEKATLLSDKLTETQDEVKSSSFRTNQNGRSERENETVIDHAQVKVQKYENEIEFIRNMLTSCQDAPADSEEYSKVTEDLEALTGDMRDLKDLLSLKRDSAAASPRSPKGTAARVHGIESSDYDDQNTSGGSALEKPVSLQEIDGLELITHDLRHQLRESVKECERLRAENREMADGMKGLQQNYGSMLNQKTEQLDTLNDTMVSERSALETRLSQLSDVIEYKDKSQDHLRKSLSFEQGRVHQLKEDLDTTYEKTFEHIKVYEGRVSTITERLNLQQHQIKARLEAYEEEIAELRAQNRAMKQNLREKDGMMDELESSHRRELRSRQRSLKKAQEESATYRQELDEVKSTLSENQGSLEEQLSQYSNVMAKFKTEISEEKEAFQRSLVRLNYLVEDRTTKIKEYKKIVADLQRNLSETQASLREKEVLNESLMRGNKSEVDATAYKSRANKAEHQVKKLKQTIEDVKYRYETQLSNKADEVLAAEMKLEKIQHELLSKIEQNNSIQNEVKCLKLEIEGAGSDNQMKDLEQKLAAKQGEVDDALYRVRRYQRETEALKDVLASYQTSNDNDVTHKISEYETTVADYEVQVTMLKKNISDLHSQLHNTYDERQKVIEKAQGQIAVYQRRLDQMNSRVEDAKSSASKEAESFKEAKKQYQRQISMLQDQIQDTQTAGENYALKQRVAKMEAMMGEQRGSKEMQGKFEMAVKRADHLQEQVDTMRKTNKRMQKTVEELWAENTQLLKDLNRTGSGVVGVKSASRDSLPNVIETAQV